MMTDGLYYPRPRHEDFELARLVHDLQEADDTVIRQFTEDPATFVTRYELDPDAVKLVTSFDYDGLVNRGIHPMLSVQFMRRVEWNLKMNVPKEEAV